LATVPTATSQVTYTCNGTTVAYTVTFKFLATGDLVVTKTETATGTVSSLTYATDYTVTGAGGTTGTVTLTAGSKCASGYTLTIKRTVAFTQGTAFSTQGSFNPKTHENAFDRLTMEAQQLDRDRAELATKQAADDAARQAADAVLSATESSNHTTELAAIAALNGTSHAVTSLSSVLAYGSSTPRTLTMRFADRGNILDYGAACDFDTVLKTGTDDTAAIQGAVDANAGATVYVPASKTGKCCMVSHAIMLPSGTTITGDGYNSCLVVKPGGWNVRVDAGPGCADTRNYGILTATGQTAYGGVSNIAIQNLRLRGAKDTPDDVRENTPNLVQLGCASDTTIDHVYFENNHYKAFWSAGSHDLAYHALTRLRFTNNYAYDIAFYGQDDGIGSEASFQWNGSHGLFYGNLITHSGNGIAANFEDNHIIGNSFYDIIGEAITIAGDAWGAPNSSVVGNHIYAEPILWCGGGTNAGCFTGIHAGGFPASANQHNSVLIADNKIYIALSISGIQTYCISARGIDADIRGNHCEYDIKRDISRESSNLYFGVNLSQSDDTVWAPYYTVSDNVVSAYTSTGAANYGTASGLAAFTTAAGDNKITVDSRHNIVRNFPDTSIAWGYGFAGAPHHLAVRMINDMAEGRTLDGVTTAGGLVNVGYSYLGARNQAFSVAFDSTVSPTTYTSPYIAPPPAGLPLASVLPDYLVTISNTGELQRFPTYPVARRSEPATPTSPGFAGQIAFSGREQVWVATGTDQWNKFPLDSTPTGLGIGSGHVAINAANSTVQELGVSTSGAFTIDNPTSAISGHRLTLRIKNTSGGALGTITWDTAYKLSTWTSPATGYSRSITLVFNGTNWVEESRTPADVPN
jgi:hypothetical protein